MICADCGTSFDGDSRRLYCRPCGFARQAEGRRGKKHVVERVPCSVVGCRKHGHDHRCSIERCDYQREDRETGYCRGHFRAYQLHGDPMMRRDYVVRPDGRCSYPMCPNRHKAKGLCADHYATRRWILRSTVCQPPMPALDAAPLIEYARSLGLSGEALALRIGVDRRYGYDLLNGHRKNIRQTVADRYCFALGIHPAILWPDEWIDLGRRGGPALGSTSSRRPSTIDDMAVSA